MPLIDVAARAALILIAALLTTLAMRRAAAATRHLVWTLAVVSVLLLPVLMIALPGWHIVPTDPRGEDLPRLAGVVVQRIAEDAVEGTFVNVEIAFGIWASVAGALLIRIFTGIHLVRRLARHARPVDARCRSILADVAAVAGVHRSIRLLVSTDITTPITWGSSRPLVLLPHEARMWSDERMRVVLLHEVAHIRRTDWLTHAIARLVAAFHWFNPFAWIALRALTRERERAVDDFVVNAGTPASSYAQHLLDLACADARRPVGSIAPAMARRNELEGRLIAVLTPHCRLARTYAAPALTVAACAVAGLIASAAPREVLATRAEERVFRSASIARAD